MSEREPFAEADAALADIEAEARKLPHKATWVALRIGMIVRLLQMEIEQARRELA